MALKAPAGNDNKKFVPQDNMEPGTYPGRVVQIIDYGLQPQKPYQGKDKPPAHELGLTYELVDEFMKDEEGKEIENKPRWISETFPVHPLFADKAKSTQRYKTFDPNEDWEGDFSQMLSLPCNVTIVNNKSGDKVYDNIATISAMRPRDAEKCPQLVNDPKMFDLDAPELEIFNKFPKWIQDKIKGNLNYAGSKLEKLLGGAPVEKAQEKPAEQEGDDNNPY
jgi:hypothetical protein